jgi:hypothetical protein
MSREFRLSKWSYIFLLVMFSLDAKTLDFSTNGMETGFFLFFVALTAYSLVIPLAKSGFYSNLRMYGFPGQSSPELVAARHAVSCLQTAYKCYAPLISYLKPEWLVLRPQEAAVVEKDNPNLLEKVYTLTRTFDVSSQLASYPFLPGRGWLQFDQKFLIYRRSKPIT